MRKTFSFNSDRELKPNYGKQKKKPAPVVEIRKQTSADQSHQKALKDVELRHDMRHVTFIEKNGWDKWLEIYNVRSFKDQIGREVWIKWTRKIKAILKERE